MAEARKERYIEYLSKDYWITIFVVCFGSMAAFGAEYCIQPLIPVVAAEFNLPPATASLAVSSGLFGMAVAMLFIAAIAPCLDRKKTTAIGLMIAAVLTIVIGFVHNFYMIMAIRFVQGCILAAFPSLMIAYINEEFADKIVGSVIGIYIASTAIGGLVGRFAVSALTDLYDWRLAMMAAGAAYLLIGVLVYVMLPNPQHVRVIPKGGLKVGSIVKGIFSDAKLLWVYAIGFCVMGSFVSVYNFIAYVLLKPPYNLSQTAIASLFAAYLVGSFSSAYMGKKTDTWGNAKVVALCVGLMFGGAIVTLFMPLWCKIVGLVLFTYGFFGAHTGACGWVGRLNKGDKAISSSLYMFFYYAGASSLGTIGGIFLERYGWFGVVGMVCVVEILCMGILMIVQRKLKAS